MMRRDYCMMRRDYLLELIEAFIQKLQKIAKLIAEGHASEAKVLLNQEAEKCIGLSLAEAGSMSDDQLLSRLLQSESTMGGRERCHLCVSVLTEAGKLALQGGQVTEGRNLFLKALQVSLSTVAWNVPAEAPAFAPTIKNLTTLLSGEPIPAYVRGALMRHFERIAAYADADWPQFRAPSASEIDTNRALPTSWNIDTGTNIRWRTPIPGLTHSSPIVVSNRIYVGTVVSTSEAELKVGL